MSEEVLHDRVPAFSKFWCYLFGHDWKTRYYDADKICQSCGKQILDVDEVVKRGDTEQYSDFIIEVAEQPSSENFHHKPTSEGENSE